MTSRTFSSVFVLAVIASCDVVDTASSAGASVVDEGDFVVDKTARGGKSASIAEEASWNKVGDDEGEDEVVSASWNDVGDEGDDAGDGEEAREEGAVHDENMADVALVDASMRSVGARRECRPRCAAESRGAKAQDGRVSVESFKDARIRCWHSKRNIAVQSRCTSMMY